jgi:hypothetical protein
MAKTSHVQTNFTSGEITPKMRARMDVARYNSGVEIMQNAWPNIHGGFSKRWGTLFHYAAKHPDRKCRVVRFVVNRTDAYWLEFGHLYMRVHKVGGVVEASPGTPYEVTTPYTEAQLDTLDFSQGADTLIIWCASAFPRRLRRFADARWVLDLAPFAPAPFAEVGSRFNVALTLSAATVGTGRTVTAASGVFLDADIGRQVWAGAGVATITAVASATSATADISVAFDGTSIAGNAWTLAGSPQATCTPSATGPVGASITLGLSAAGWRASDVGSHVEINTGLVKITAFGSDTSVTGEVMVALNTTVAAPANAWALKPPAWNDFDGYPATGTFHAQRLLAAGTTSYPQTIWGSAMGEFFNFQLGTLDTDAFAYELVSDDVSPITYMISMESLVALSFAGEFTIDGGVEKPITPTNVRAKPRSTRGCQQVRPVKVGAETLFVQRTGKRVRAASFQDAADAWAVPDMSVVADHLTNPGVVGLTWHEEPGTLLFALRADGLIASCTYDRDQDVVGWARQSFAGGLVESAATIPDEDADKTMLVVRRVIDGVTVRYLEMLDSDTYTDSAIKGTAGTATAVWSGLDHLEGETVRVRADDIPQPPLVVDGGEITLARPATTVEIGKAIGLRVKLLPPEVSGGAGVSKGAAVSVNKVFVEVLNTIGLTVNGEDIAFRQFGEDVVGMPIEPFTGIKEVSALGWSIGGGAIEITHDEPLPCNVLAVVRHVTVNEG